MKILSNILIALLLGIGLAGCDGDNADGTTEKPDTGSGDGGNPIPREPEPPKPIALTKSCQKQGSQKERSDYYSAGYTVVLENTEEKDKGFYQCKAIELNSSSIVISSQCYQCIFGDESSKDIRNISIYRDSELIQKLPAKATGTIIPRKNVVNINHHLVEIPVDFNPGELAEPKGNAVTFLSVAKARAMMDVSRSIRVVFPDGSYTDAILAVNTLSESRVYLGDPEREYQVRQLLVYSAKNEDLRGGILLAQKADGTFVTEGLVLHKLFPDNIKEENKAWVVEQITSVN